MKISKYRFLYSNLALSIGFALLLVVFRVKLTDNTFYLFLVWNLFLAGIPYAITQLFKLSNTLRSFKIIRGLGFLAWLLFLPNSPYIITDLVHLHSSRSVLVWLDLFLVFVFAFNGLLLGLLSMLDMFSLIREFYGHKISKYMIFIVCLLCGYGIYLGRFLRFNSWDITTKPISLVYEIAYSLKEPMVWLMTFAFGGFLWILFIVMQSLLTLKTDNETAIQ